MPWARSRSSWMVSFTASPSASSISAAASGSSARMSLVRRRFTASATRCCCAPSWRLRSILRRSASPVATMRAREVRRSSLARFRFSRLSCSAESSWTLWSASPTWRASSVRTRSSSSVKWSPSAARSITSRPSSSPECDAGATRSCDGGRSSRRAGSHTSSHALPVTPARVTTGCSSGPRCSGGGGAVGHRHRQLEASRACRSRSRPGAARAPCGATRPAGAAARPSGSIG